MATLGNYNFNFNKSLEIKSVQDKALNISFKRLLAKGEPQREFENTRNRKGLADNIVCKGKTKYISENISRFSHKNDKGLNNFDVYMKNYNRRYSQKKGLSKLDCYYEKKIFDKFQNICELAKKANYDKKRCKKLFYRKYGIGLILFSFLPVLGFIFPILGLILFILLPLLGFIFPILFWSEEDKPALINFCTEEKHAQSSSRRTHDHTCNCYPLLISEKALLVIDRFNTVFFAIIAIINAAIIIYVLIKVLKYERLNSKKVKMRIQ
ncbi:Plasmodium exported protein, unknown function [Plasmodium vivax]|uniref:Uncharacterized protein n=1 Tax=Plasmodium vivax TaxID=5855 RepID=A0A565A7W1_PLAVI|nr:Plasmodium exported protein, unknown function [Plasmodium vivax]